LYDYKSVEKNYIFMKAIVFNKSGVACTVSQVNNPKPNKGQILVRVIAASLNRRDYWIKVGVYRDSTFPCIVGSDASGIIEAVGEGVDEKHIGQEIIINPGIGWGNNRDYHASSFNILGQPTQGTLAEFVCVPIENVWPKPTGWTFEKAAALPLAGLTAYRALFTRAKLQQNENVLITGIGGGVAMFLLKFAVAAGANVYVTSSSEKKIKRAIALGAKSGVLYNLKNWDKELLSKVEEGFDAIIDSAAGDNFAKFPSMLKIGGKIVTFGGTAGKIPELTAAQLFWKQASVLGTTMGSPWDFEEMLKYSEEHNIQPEIDKIFPMEDTEIAFKHMENQEQFGKLVIKIGNISR
jgi:zinc-binding alcohol dehydrogenase/oxidoreductase